MGKIVKHTKIYCDACEKDITRELHCKIRCFGSDGRKLSPYYFCYRCYRKIIKVVRGGGVDGKE